MAIKLLICDLQLNNAIELIKGCRDTVVSQQPLKQEMLKKNRILEKYIYFTNLNKLFSFIYLYIFFYLNLNLKGDANTRSHKIHTGTCTSLEKINDRSYCNKYLVF